MVKAKLVVAAEVKVAVAHRVRPLPTVRAYVLAVVVLCEPQIGRAHV